MIFETFCRIHQCISIRYISLSVEKYQGLRGLFSLFLSLSMLAEKLNMEPKDAEHWIVDLIRNAHLNAKIDSKLVNFFFQFSQTFLILET